jgi:chromate transporter
MIYLKLFWSFFQVGLFSIGGGYAALPLIQNQVVELNHWLTLNEFSDVITISQMTPGPIAINSATFVGTKIAGIGGAIIATLGCIFPSCIIVLALAYFYTKYKDLKIVQGVLQGLRPAVVALIASAGISILFFSFFGVNTLPTSKESIDFIAITIFAFCIFVLRKFKVNPIYVMIGAGVIGVLVYYIYK